MSKETEERKAWRQQYQRENRERLAAYRREWRRKRLGEKPELREAENKAAREYYHANHEHCRTYGREYYYRVGKSKRTPEGRFKEKLRQKYGLTVERYNELLEATGGRCPICREPITRETAHIDHCHKTGIVRGLLCRLCNQAEGFLRTPEIALRMYNYMVKNSLFYEGGS